MLTFWTDHEGLAELVSDLKDFKSPSDVKLRIGNYVHTAKGHHIRVKLTRQQVKYLMKTVDIRQRYER